MKKLIVLFSLVAFIGAGAFAQGVSGGVKGGLNIANVNASGGGVTADTKSLVGFHLGAYVTAMFSSNLGIQGELLYSTQGYNYDVPSGSTLTSHINYLTIPILFRYNVNEMISFHAGPQLGLLTTAKSTYGNTTTDFKDQLDGTDLNLAFGGTIDLPMKLNFTARYCLGLSDVDKNSSSSSKNRAFQISIGYKLFGVNK